MPGLHSKQLSFFSGLLAIVVIYSVYNIYFIDTSYYHFIPKIVRHLVGLGCALLIYGIGTYTLKMYNAGWMMLIWHLLHAILIVLFLLIGIYAWGLGPISIQWHNLAL